VGKVLGTIRSLSIPAMVTALALLCVTPGAALAARHKARHQSTHHARQHVDRPTVGHIKPHKVGGLDCNGMSPIQRASHADLACTDLHNSHWLNDRFYDNGRYIGHDEPDLNFTSNQPGSGNNISWTFTIGNDPAAAATDAHPGRDISHWFELTPALWFSLPMCDPDSYPQTACTPESDSNVPHGNNPGGGSAFMELQFYPPGFGPWVDAPSFDNKHWGAALTIDSFEGTASGQVNTDCEEPVNFAFIQRNGVPEGPPSPQDSDLASSTPNSESLLMNPGDRIHVHMYDAPAPGGGRAFEAVVTDLSTGQTGWMQASAANGFMNTSIVNCDGTPFNFEAEYNTAKPANVAPWGAGTENVSASFETGHWEPCTSLSNPGTLPVSATLSDTFYNTCSGPYEDSPEDADGGTAPETSDAFCFPKGDTHGGLAAGFPDTMTGCEDNYDQNGDLDFDGPPYWTEWPTSPYPGRTPGSFQISAPTYSGGQEYNRFQFQTDIAFSEPTTCSTSTPTGCTAPPPNAPGGFYPFWTLESHSGGCVWEFGDVTNGGDDFGGDAQYGSIGTPFPDLQSDRYQNACRGDNNQF
jgi:hypothetical protein